MTELGNEMIRELVNERLYNILDTVESRPICSRERITPFPGRGKGWGWVRKQPIQTETLT